MAQTAIKKLHMHPEPTSCAAGFQMRAAAEDKAIKIFESNLGTITNSDFDAWFVEHGIKG